MLFLGLHLLTLPFKGHLASENLIVSLLFFSQKVELNLQWVVEYYMLDRETTPFVLTGFKIIHQHQTRLQWHLIGRQLVGQLVGRHMDSLQQVTLGAALETSQQPALAWLTAGICQTCSSTYPFRPNSQKALEQGQQTALRGNKCGNVFHPYLTISDKCLAPTLPFLNSR